MKKVGVFAAGFDPVHMEHVAAAEAFIHAVYPDVLTLCPVSAPWEERDLFPCASVKDRLALLRLAMAHIPSADVPDICEENNDFFHVMNKLHEEMPGASFTVLLPERALSVPEDVKLFSRLHFVSELCILPDERGAPDALQSFCHRLQMRHGIPIRVLRKTMKDVSSAAKRMLLLGGGDLYLSDAVIAEIRLRGLYCSAMDCRHLTYPELEKMALRLYSSARINHALGCSRAAVYLAERYGADPAAAERAGILHDITKVCSDREQLHLCEKYDIMTDDYVGDQTKLLHGKTAAAAAERIFGESSQVCDAISWHTTGRNGMSCLEKVIYLADYIEPNRKFDGVEELRSLADRSLDAAVLRGIEMTISMLLEKKRSLNRHSLEACEYLKQRSV